MAYTCPWPCVSDTVNSTLVTATVVSTKSFAAALGGKNSTIDTDPLSTPCIKGDALSIRIGQDEYQRGLAECQNALRARLTLSKGDKPYTASDLSTKLGTIWKTTAKWKMVPLGKGYYDFHFELADDLRKIWAAGTDNLKPGLLRLSQWTKDFKYLAQKQTHVSLWIRLVELPQECWRERTLKEIASAVGTPIDIDGPTRNRTFGHYARILVDIDLSKKAYDEILVERDGFAFKVAVQYERRPLFCHHCFAIGHNISTCRWLHPQPPKDKNDRGKQAEAAPPKPSRQNIDVGASTSANGSTSMWVPVLVVSTVTTTQRVPVSAAPTSLVLTSLAIPDPIYSPTLNFSSQVGPISIVTSTVATSQTDVPVSMPSLSSNSFGFPLHNVFDIISPEELPRVIPVLEVVSPIAQVDVHPGAERLHQTSREELENPTLDVVTVTLSDDVENNRSSPRKLVESPKGYHERVPHSSPDEHNEVHEVSVESVQVQTNNVVEHVDVHSGSGHSLVSPAIVERSLAVSASMPTTIQEEQLVTELQQQEVHPSKNIQHGLDLWVRVREYDERSAVEDFTPVLTRKQKQKIKIQQVIAKQPTKTRSRGGNHPTTPYSMKECQRYR